MPQPLARSVLVLGGGSEIARAFVSALISSGTRKLALAGRSSDSLTAAEAEAKRAGADEVYVAEWDARQLDGHEALFRALPETHLPLDLVVMAVGVLGDQETAEQDPREAASLIESNFTGPAAACLVAGDFLASQGMGTLMVLSSVAAVRMRRENFIYGSAKAGLDGFCLGLGYALAPKGVRVMVVRPGFVRTKMTAGKPSAPFATTADRVAEDMITGLIARRRIVWSPPYLRWLMLAGRALPDALYSRI
jgi:decaprenylphospho-beta-D-erythro-pentofuranosid-2-ulose 2-reductase